MNSFLQIKKISDLTRVCILPVMVMSIFLSFFLYIDMGKIQDKAQDLVDGAIPHISAAQQGAISLVQLRRNIEILSSSVDQQRCRLAYFQATAALKDNLIFNTRSLQTKRDELLLEVNRLWKQRILIDQLRSNVHNSLHYMDMLAFLITSEQPEIFTDLTLTQGDYIDLYRTGVYNRDLKSIHHYYHSIFTERLDPSFDRQSFINSHPVLPRTIEGEEGYRQGKTSADTSQAAISPAGATASAATAAAAADNAAAENAGAAADKSGTQASGKTEAVTDIESAVLAALTGSDTSTSEQENKPAPASAAAGDEVSLSAESAQAQIKAQSKKHPSGVELPAFVSSEDRAVSTIVGGAEQADLEAELEAMSGRDNGATGIEELDQAMLERVLKKHTVDGSHIHARYFQGMDSQTISSVTAQHNARMLDYYSQELERFDPIWDIYIKQQREFANDVLTIIRNVEDLSDDFNYSELHSLHQELSDITYLASETKPMVMITIGFGLVGFWVVIFFLNRLVMQPLRTIARILIKFRYTKQVNLGRYEDFFKRQHLVEIREVIDVLPQIFEEFSSIKENSNVLKKRYDELVTHSKYDALTRVFNRGSLNVLIKELDTNTPANFAILMIDIDFFKLLNDSMGHQRGDEVLFAVAQTIHHNLAKKDLVYRYGGEEFCVILSDVNKENAFRVADRLCRTVEGLHLKNDGVVSGNVTISVGLSLVTDRPGQFRIEEMIAQADRALYEAKHAGRNRVHACNEAIALETHGISIGENKAHENTESKPEKKEDKDDSEPDPGQESSSAVIAQIAAIEQKVQERMIGSNDTDSLAMASFVGNEGSFSIGSFERAISLPSESDSPELFDFDQDALKNMNEEERKATVEKLRAIEEDEAREVAEAANSLMGGLLGVFFINSNEDTSDYFDRQRKELNNYISTPAYFYYLERKKCQRELLEEAREKEILQAIQKAAEAQAAEAQATEAKIAETQSTESNPAGAQATEAQPAKAQATEAQSAEAHATEAHPAEAQADADVAAAAEAIDEESSASSAGRPLASDANGDADAANDKEKTTAVAQKSADTVAISNDSDDHEGSTSSSGSNNAGDTASQTASQTDSGKSQSQELSVMQRTTLAASSGSCLVANADTAREVAAVIEAEERRSPRRKALRHLRRLNLRIKALRKYRNLRTAHTSMEHGVTEHIRRNYTSSTEGAGHDSAVLIGVDYFESNSRSEGTNSIQLSQDGSAYEVSFTASELAHEVELRKEYNSKLNNAIGDTVSVRNEPQANVVVVDRDGYNEVSIGPHTVDLPDKRNASFDKDNSTSGDISQSKTDSKA